MVMEDKRKYNFDDQDEKDHKKSKNNACAKQIYKIDFTHAPDKNLKPTRENKIFKTLENLRKYFHLNNLIRDLDEVLNEDIRGVITEILSVDALNHCLSLQTCLNDLKDRVRRETISNIPVLKDLTYELSKLPKVVSPLYVSPWKSSSIPNEYPTLPEILDPTLEAATFTHCSYNSDSEGALNYEQLELIGDAYMELIATLLISQTFPFLSPGKQSQIREMLIKNITLANYSLAYKFDERLKMDCTLQRSNSVTKVKVLGDVFEAYVAAVILSDPMDGVRRVSQWLKSLWSMTIAATITQQENSDCKVSSHLWNLRGNIPPEEIAEAFNNRPIQLNAKEKLQKLIGGKHAKLSYRDIKAPFKDPHTKLAVFSIGVFLDGWGEKNKMLGSGQANSKKEAGLKAATVALENQDLIKAYAEKKISMKELEDKNN